MMNRIVFMLLLFFIIGCSTKPRFKVALMFTKECYLFVDQQNNIVPVETNDSILCLLEYDSAVYIEMTDSLKFLFYGVDVRYRDACTGISYSKMDTSKTSSIILRYSDLKEMPAFIEMSKEIIIGNNRANDTILLDQNYNGTFDKKNDYNSISINDWIFSKGYQNYKLELKDTIYINMIRNYTLRNEEIMRIVIDKTNTVYTERIKGITWYVMDSIEVKQGFVNGLKGLIPK